MKFATRVHTMRCSALTAGLFTLAMIPGHLLGAQTLPYHGTKSSPSTLWWMTQTGGGPTGAFEIKNSKNKMPALSGTTNGTGMAGEFDINNASNGNPALFGHTDGPGYAVYGESINAVGAGIYGLSTATTPTNGAGVDGNSQHGSGVAGHSDYGVGVYGSTAAASNGGGYAGYFSGPVEVSGNLVVTGTFSNPSDARYKTNVKTLPDALDIVLGLRAVSFDWRQREFPDMRFGKGHQIGFIAQEVEKVLPEVVTRNRKGYMGLEYAKMVPVSFEAIKEQQQQIGKLQQQIADQQQQITELRDEVRRANALHVGRSSSETTSLGALVLLCGGVSGSLVMRRLRVKR